MEHGPSGHPWLVALEQSGFAVAIRDAVWIYPAANVLHVLAIAVFFALVAAMDFRLLGFARAVPAGIAVASLRPFAILALLAVVASGFILFSAEATALVQNPVFLLKMALIGVGLVNVGLLEAFWRRRDLKFDVPPAARAAALISVLLWFAIIGLGRFIAYL